MSLLTHDLTPVSLLTLAKRGQNLPFIASALHREGQTVADRKHAKRYPLVVQ